MKPRDIKESLNRIVNEMNEATDPLSVIAKELYIEHTKCGMYSYPEYEELPDYIQDSWRKQSQKLLMPPPGFGDKS